MSLLHRGDWRSKCPMMKPTIRSRVKQNGRCIQSNLGTSFNNKDAIILGHVTPISKLHSRSVLNGLIKGCI